MLSYSKAGVLVVLFTAVVSCGESDGGGADSGAEATNGTQGSSQTAASSTSSTSSTSATSSASATSATNGNGATTDTGGAGGGTSTSSTTATVGATSVGGAAGDTNSTTGGGGLNGECPNEPPVNGGSCDGLGFSCAYEDCDGAGRSIAQCTQGTWFVETGACPETVYCNGGSMTCAPGEVCLVMAGGAFLQNCVPNTCDGEAVACDCIEGCFGECPAFGTVDMGITITCNTCPSGQCP